MQQQVSYAEDDDEDSDGSEADRRLKTAKRAAAVAALASDLTEYDDEVERILGHRYANYLIMLGSLYRASALQTTIPASVCPYAATQMSMDSADMGGDAQSGTTQCSMRS